MPATPRWTIEQIQTAFPQVSDPVYVTGGGQKGVYRCKINDTRYALKILHQTEPDVQDDPSSDTEELFAEYRARAKREVSILEGVSCPYLVALGPLPLDTAALAGETVLYFTEEWIEGRDLADHLKASGPLELAQLKLLALQMAQALGELSSLNKVHRDIKPANIIKREGLDEYVLLDMGMALDLDDVSLTQFGAIVGTPKYFSPEQLDLARKRQLDFRSDLFSLGIVLYELGTGSHPFWKRGVSTGQLLDNLLRAEPIAPSQLTTSLPKEFDSIVLRLLAKEPHLRYRKLHRFESAVNSLP